MESEVLEAFHIISIAPEYYVLAVVAAIALFVFLRWNAMETKVWLTQADEEMRPIAAAFDITERRDTPSLQGCAGRGRNGSLEVHWHLKDPDWHLDYVIITTANGGYDTHVRYDGVEQKYKVWWVGAASGELMARGLYRLGFDEDILAQLPALSAHEKLELRLSLPREFWPQKWLDEVKVN